MVRKMKVLILFLLFLITSGFSKTGMPQEDWEAKFGKLDRGSYRANGYALRIDVRAGKVAYIHVTTNGGQAMTESQAQSVAKSLKGDPSDIVRIDPKRLWVEVMTPGFAEGARQSAAESSIAEAAIKIRFEITQILDEEIHGEEGAGAALLGYAQLFGKETVQEKSGAISRSVVRETLSERHDEPFVIFGGDSSQLVDGSTVDVIVYPAGRFKYDSLLGPKTVRAFHLTPAGAIARLSEE